MSRVREELPSAAPSGAVEINDPVTFKIARDRRHVAGTVVWIDRHRGTVEIIDREGHEHTKRIAEVRRQQWKSS